ncbi:adenosylcobalamin-dependent ribonucleoside-diphosphate reductase [Candidatus Woesearchaeota archaeon]|nr:adenosylcobalamin-dependent ribonucleoside-diphosphate reductase [Candidatus Woesearchaeota archaeon]
MQDPHKLTELTGIKKRSGKVVVFDHVKIADAIFKAALSVNLADRTLSLGLANDVLTYLKARHKDNIPSAEVVQDLVEEVLIERGHVKIAKAYILHRHQKDEQRKTSALIIGTGESHESLNFSHQALRILERRYLQKDVTGNLTETPQQMLQRVSENVAKADKFYNGTDTEIKNYQERFFNVMSELKFMPNSPTLKNAGTKTQQLSSCFVLPIQDTMEGIFGTLKDAALIHQRGSGTGFSFSRLRPRMDAVGRHQGIAAGPVAFMKVYDKAFGAIVQGGIRPGANMAVLRVDHPDIIRFIESKRDKMSLKNFNISVGVTDRFMKSVEADRDYMITDPKSGKQHGKLRARDVFSMITQNAWKTGDPGLIFIDEINRKHPGNHLGDIETTNQCGEAPLLPYEGVVLGSLNLNKFVENKEILWDDLYETIKTAVHFLDNVIDMNSYPQKEIEDRTKHTRKFGLGMMGFADFLIKLGIKYDSDQGLEVADKLMVFIKNTTYEMSSKLAEQRGSCPAWSGSEHEQAGRKMRNLTCNSLAPTGTISILADASPGCEPLFAISYQKTVLGDSEIIYLNKTFENVAKERGFYTPELIRKIAKSGGIQGFKEIPKDVRDIFVTAQDITPEWHIKMQATLQKNVDNSISKTINFPRTTSIKDVENAYMLAWKSKCKGITIYRDGSYEDQVINIGDGY